MYARNIFRLEFMLLYQKVFKKETLFLFFKFFFNQAQSDLIFIKKTDFHLGI